jgi:hypothetical protein
LPLLRTQSAISSACAKSSLTSLLTLLSLATALLATFVASAHAADNPAEVFELPSVNVVGTAPLPGLGSALRDVPANVQIFDNRLLERMRPLTLTQFLDMNANSVGAQSGQGNPFQQSLNFRGFAASPLLGTPQGISVFQDGVRINEAFGDVVNWDLLPCSAISSVQLIPGRCRRSASIRWLARWRSIRKAARNIRADQSKRRAARSGGARSNSRTEKRASMSTRSSRGTCRTMTAMRCTIRAVFANSSAKSAAPNDRSDLDVSITLADNALHG